MNCKNCKNQIKETQKFCSYCGAKIVINRISTRNIFKNFIKDFFSLDNKYFLTITTLLLQPKLILKEYIEGTRKKYVAPFTFLAIGMALAMLIFNEFSDNYIELSNVVNEKQFDIIEGQFENTEGIEKQRIESKEMTIKIQNYTLKYFNILTLILIPFYALIAFLVYRKPYNYGEHLIITCYIQGVLFLSAILFFFLGIIINPAIYYLSLPIAIIYYLYAYGQLYDLTFGKTLIKLLKFIGILLILITGIGILTFLISLIAPILFK